MYLPVAILYILFSAVITMGKTGPKRKRGKHLTRVEIAVKARASININNNNASSTITTITPAAAAAFFGHSETLEESQLPIKCSR